MTFVGKILVVVQLVLSLLFMTFAGAVFSVEQNWKTARDSVQQDLKAEEESHAATRKDFNRLKTDTTDEIAKLGDLSKKWKSNFDQLQNSTANLQAEYELKKTEEGVQRTVAKLEITEAQFRLDEALEQREVNKALHKKQVDLVNTNRTLEDNIFNLNLVLGKQEQRHLVVLDELKTTRALARRKGGGLGALPSKDVAPPPPISGKVLSARYGIGNRILYIEISIGGDDGIKEGQLLTVWRPGNDKQQRTKFLGKVRIIHVFPDKAVGTIGQKAKNGVISKGDNVTSKL